MGKILITGKDGQIGRELTRALHGAGEVVAVGRQQMDLANFDAVRRTLRDVRPDIIVNAAGYTTVDKAEAEPDLAMHINAKSTSVIAEEAKRIGAFLFHYSSAYVFDGAIGRPYAENDYARPVNAYGKSKLAGEKAIADSGVGHLILRLSWVYCDHGRNFLLAMLKLARERASIDVVEDHIASPTWARSIAEATRHILSAPGREGIYHYSADGETSRFGWTVRLFELLREMNHGLAHYPLIKPVPASEYPDTAVRPARCVMSNAKIRRDFGLEILPWEEQLRSCLTELVSRSRPA